MIPLEIKSQEKITSLMYIHNIKLFAKKRKKKEMEQLTQTRILNSDTGMEFGTENVPCS